jgi:ATP-dependent DNA helicase DinG
MISPDTFIAVDVETTGLDPSYSEIIEIGAVKVDGGIVRSEFSELVKPTKPIPDAITHLTGITNEDVRNAQPVEEIIKPFLDFISGYQLLGHNVGFDISFLRHAAGLGNITSGIDTIELSRILLPRLHSYSLDSLIEFFALNPKRRHRALDDAHITAVVFLKLLDMLNVASVPFLNEMVNVSVRTGSILKEVFEVLLLSRAEESSIGTGTSLPSLPKRYETSDNIFGNVIPEAPSTSESQTVKIDPEIVASYLRKGGALGSRLNAYEERTGQIAFAKKVAEAFNDSNILLAEAGTGTGKSLAYLLPAVIWAHTARERVIISTNTNNLQEQLFFKDIPLVNSIGDSPFRAVILKGRQNYICLHRWQRLVISSDRYLSKEERALMLPVASWLLETTTGDLSETGFFNLLAESGLLERINSESISCLGARCSLREECFVNRIRRAAQNAHIIIVNHSLVFSDMVSDGSVLGHYSRIVFDEAHNLEKVALRFLGVSLNYYRVRKILNRLYSRNDQEYGLCVTLREWADDMVKGWPEFKRKAEVIETTISSIVHLYSVTSDLFSQCMKRVVEEAKRAENGHERKLRYGEESPVFTSCSEIVTVFNETVSELYQAIQDTSRVVSSVSSVQLAQRDEILIDLEKSLVDLQSVIDDFVFLRKAVGQNVFWFEYDDDNNAYSLKIQSAPLDVAEKLAIGLYDQMETVIMTSATLTVARDFSYMRDRLGLNLDQKERVVEFIAASPFDYKHQAVVVIPSFIPSPKHDLFIESANEVILSLAQRVRRGMLVLFTSRGHLMKSYYDLRDEFVHSGITLLVQGVDGSRNLILRRFREETTSVLFGMESFWEGVDVPGSALELVVIVKLPFAVPTEPIIQAQMEEIQRQGRDPFINFSVPDAAIKLRQGAGRLIRHRTDKGAIIILDKRIVTAQYGTIFRKSLMGSTVRVENMERMIETVHEWFLKQQ